MSNASAARFRFIGHALAGDGPFRPVVSTDGLGHATQTGLTYLIRYPRESDSKFARRNELAFYASPLAQASSRFVGYLAMKPPTREIPHDLYEVMEEDIDGKGNSIEEFFHEFLINAKSRGSMLLLVDMDSSPEEKASNLQSQISNRVVPYWSAILPESVTDYAINDDGKFSFVEFAGNWTAADDSRIPCIWHFDLTSWKATTTDSGKTRILSQGTHPLGECPVLIWTEGGDFPYFGPFSAIADLSKRVFNLDSELDEILRAQTFSILTMQVPDGTSEQQKIAMAQTSGQTIGTSNLVVHTGSTPTFIAPPDGPANIYLQRIKDMRVQIDEIGLNVATINQQESGIAMKMRFQTINASLAAFAERMEGLEERAWMLSQKWLGLSVCPDVSWPDDYDIADVETELKILHDMQSAAMPPEVVAAEEKRIVQLQFGNMDTEEIDSMVTSIDERLAGVQESSDSSNVVALPDRNASVREAIVRSLEASNGAS